MGKISKEKFKVFEGVFDQFTLRTLETLKRKHYFDELGKPIKTGKEGDVYFAYKDDEVRAVKMYRMTSANFKKISEYITRDFRFKNIKGNLRKVILVWTEKEFRNLNLCHKAQMNVPTPYKFENNVLVMEYIEGPMLKDAELGDPQLVFDMLKEQIDLLINEAKLIHGDLSEFNILVKDQIPYLIDFGQGMSIKNSDDFRAYYDLYERDITNVVNFFNRRYDLEIDLEKILEELSLREESEQD